MAFNRARRIKLEPLSVRGFLATRLMFLLNEPDNEGFLKKVWQALTLSPDRLQNFVKKYVDDSNVARFPYPFNGRTEIFMQRITNGNINEIIDIAITLLCYCHSKKALTNLADKTIDLHRGDVIDALAKPNSLYRMFDIDIIKSQRRGRKAKQFQNNSTIQNVLEMISISEYADESFYNRLCGKEGDERYAGYGHTIEETKRALSICITARLIEEKVHSTGGPDFFLTNEKYPPRESGPFSLTEKGEFYLQDVLYWDAYVKAFRPNHADGFRSIFDATNEGDIGRFALERDILEFLVTLLQANSRQSGYLKVSKDHLYSFFADKYCHAYWHRFRSRSLADGEGYSTLSDTAFKLIISRRGWCSPRKEEQRPYFALRHSRIKAAAHEASIPYKFDSDKFSLTEFSKFVNDHTSWTELEE